MTPEEVLELLRPKHELWNSPHFQEWAKEGDAEIAQLMTIAMTVTKASVERSAATAQILEKLGIEPPQDLADSYQVFVHLRVVVNFWRRKLEQLKLQSDTYTKQEKQLSGR